MNKAVCSLFTLALLIEGSLAIKCFICLPSKSNGTDCRMIGSQVPQNCPEDSKHCVAVVLGNANGDITVSRGCGNHIQEFNLGDNECAVLDSFTDDLPAAYYKCKTDGCNNIEPVSAEVTEVVKVAPANGTSQV